MECEKCEKEISNYEVELSRTTVSHNLCEKHQKEAMNLLNEYCGSEYVCPKCKIGLSEKDMGHRCPKCGEWQYHHLAKVKDSKRTNSAPKGDGE